MAAVGTWLSLVEHSVRDAGVVGSNPSVPTRFFSETDYFTIPSNSNGILNAESFEVAIMSRIQRAVLSVTDKSGIQELAKELHDMGIEIISTGGTARVIREADIPVKDVSDLTGFPEMMDGRVKTLHPKVHGGILAIRDNATHAAQMKEHDIPEIDMVVVNLYAFEKTVAKQDVTLAEAIENIDIGGPTLLRSSAKNFRYVTVVVDPEDYSLVLDEMKNNGGTTTLATRFKLARKVFATTSGYDAAITEYLNKIDPETDDYFK